ncbi:MAG: zinc ribbon domain-containing protein [Actinomycetota bacterium]|nr:zinc ribbon domain-containing protein [Actinomycetota bacterium]
MGACPRCGEGNPDQARFCLACGQPIGPQLAPAEERKTVSILFVDLAGFTSRSDEADPEEVRDTLRPYHALLKREVGAVGS